MINTSLVWLVGVLAIWRSPKHLFPLIAMASIIVVNGIVHLLAGVVKFQYNPGLLTSIIIFIPLYTWFVRIHGSRSEMPVTLWEDNNLQMAQFLDIALFCLL